MGVDNDSQERRNSKIDSHDHIVHEHQPAHEIGSNDHIDSKSYAGFWMRFWAYTIDLIVVFSINGILLSPLKVVTNGTEMNLGAWTLAGILGVIILYGYFVVMTKYFGQTIGKMILGLKVIRKDFEPLQWSDLIFREVVGRFFYRVLAWTGILYLVVAFDQRKRGIHDMIGDTIVIHEK